MWEKGLTLRWTAFAQLFSDGLLERWGGEKYGSVGRGEPRKASRWVGTYGSLAMGQGCFGGCYGPWNVCL